MKITCKVNGKPAMVVGYAPGKKNRPLAIVICQGKLQAVKLRNIDLAPLKEDVGHKLNPVELRSLTPTVPLKKRA